MIKYEAIIALSDRNNLLWGMSKEEQKYYSEALDMAISALEKNESAEEWYKLLCEKWDEGDYACNIPKGMTNGEVIKVMFPNASYHYHKASDIVDDYVSVCINDCDTQQDYSMAWWNAPYQKGGE